MFSNKILFLTLTLSILTSACTTLPSREEMKTQTSNYELPLAPKKGLTRVFVVRPDAIGTLIRFNVFLDSENAPAAEMGWTRGSQHIYFYLEPGPHKIYSHAENTAAIDINAHPDETLFIKQEANMGFIMARNSIYLLDDVTGKYHMMKTGAGEIKKTTKDQLSKN
jgi:hypothetical protein